MPQDYLNAEAVGLNYRFVLAIYIFTLFNINKPDDKLFILD